MKNVKRFSFLLLSDMGCIVLFGLLFLYINNISGQTAPTFPRVTINNTTIPEGARRCQSAHNRF